MVQWISPLLVLTNTTFIRMDAARRPQLWCSHQTGSVHGNDTTILQSFDDRNHRSFLLTASYKD